MNQNTFENSEILNVLKEDNPYKILGIPENTTVDEINKVYRNLAKQFHPDKHLSKKGSKEFTEIEIVFKIITKAFNLLKDPEERKKFDEKSKIKLSPQAPPPPTTHGINIRVTMPGTLNLNNLFSENEREELKKSQAESFFDSAVNEYKKGNFDKAVKNLQSSIRINSETAKYHSYLGLTMKAKGWKSYAQSEFKIALKQDPFDAIALENYIKIEYNPTNDNNKKSILPDVEIDKKLVTRVCKFFLKKIF